MENKYYANFLIYFYKGRLGVIIYNEVIELFMKEDSTM